MPAFTGKLKGPTGRPRDVEVEAPDARAAVRRILRELDPASLTPEARYSLDVDGVVTTFYPDELDELERSVGYERADKPCEPAPNVDVLGDRILIDDPGEYEYVTARAIIEDLLGHGVDSVVWRGDTQTWVTSWDEGPYTMVRHFTQQQLDAYLAGPMRVPTTAPTTARRTFTVHPDSDLGEFQAGDVIQVQDQTTGKMERFEVTGRHQLTGSAIELELGPAPTARTPAPEPDPAANKCSLKYMNESTFGVAPPGRVEISGTCEVTFLDEELFRDCVERARHGPWLIR